MKNCTPHEAWYGKKPGVHHLKVFGSVAYAHIPAALRNKLDDKSEKCIFIGYSERSKAYKLYNPVTKQIVISRDVQFDEDSFFNELEIQKENFQIFPFECEGEEEMQLENNENIFEGGNSPSSPSSSSSSYESPIRKTRSLRELYDVTDEVELDEAVYFAFFFCR